MNIISISDDLMTVLTKISNQMKDAEAGLNHFASTIKQLREQAWNTIYAEFPELDGWILQFDIQNKTLTKLHLKGRE